MFESREIHAKCFRDQGRFFFFLDLNGIHDSDENAAATFVFSLFQHGVVADSRTDLDGSHKANLVETVVDHHLGAGRDCTHPVAHHHEQGKKQIAMCDSSAEQPPFGKWRAHMYPLVVTSAISKSIYAILIDLNPVRDANIFADVIIDLVYS